MAPLKVSLLGYGGIARTVHAPALGRHPRVKLVAVAEADPARRDLCHRDLPGARVFESWKELLNAGEAGAVLVCLPNALHAEAATAALAAGLHVYVEKPLATAIEEAAALAARSLAPGQVAMVGFNYRFHPFYVEARRRIRAGALGQVVTVRSSFSTAPRELPGWKRRRDTGGGVLLDLASHHIDLLRFLFDDEVVEVSARLASGRSEDDTAWVQCRLAGGLVAQSFFSFAAIDEDRCEICGDRGKLIADRLRGWSLETMPAAADYRRISPLRQLVSRAASAGRSPLFRRRLLAPGSEISYGRALAHFGDAARSGRPASPSLADGLRCLEVVVAAEQSARSNRPVAIGETAS